MVKTRALFLAAALFMISGCSVFVRSEKANPEVLQLASGRLGAEVSLARAAGALVAVYSDVDTTGLYEVEIPIADHLPAAAPEPRLIDRIDVGPPLADSFGRHALAARGTTVTVLYQARAPEDKTLLKLASHAIGSADWSVDAVEPSGVPLAVLPVGEDRVDLFWAAGSLLRKSYPGTDPADSVVSSFLPSGRAGTFMSGAHGNEADSAVRGMTAFDSTSSVLFMLRWNGASYDAVKVDGAGPVNSSLALADGRVAILSWVPSTRRLELETLGQDASRPSRTAVTISAGTNEVQLLPSPPRDRSPVGAAEPADEPRADRLLFLYDDVRRLGGGRSSYELSLLAPGARWGLGAHRYRRVVLLSGSSPVESFSAVEVGGMLYVLVRQDGVKLLEWKLP